MAIAFRAAGTASSGASSCTPGLPAGTVENDILVCVASATGNAAFTWPAGWTEIAANNMSGTRRLEVRWKRAGASEAAPSISFSGSNIILAQIAGYSGCVASGSPVDQVSAVTNQTTLTLTYAAVTPTVVDTELVLAGSVAANVTVSGYSGTNPAPAERFDSGAVVSSAAQVHLASGAKTDTASSASRTASRSSGSVASGTFQFNLLPAAAATAVGKDAAVPWTVRQAIGAVRALPWTVKQPVAKAGALPWTVRAAIRRDLVAPWVDRAAVGADSGVAWTVRTAVADVLELPWGLAGAVGADAQLAWTVRQAAADELDLDWTVLDVVAAEAGLPWTVLGLVGSDAGLEWVLRGLVDGDLEVAWAVFAAPTGSPVRFAIVARPRVGFGVAAHHRVAFEIEGRIVTTMRLSAT